jgi:hypothetical protein
MITGEQLARHLRHNKGVKINVYRTVIPHGWTPPPESASKLYINVTLGYRNNWIQRFKHWHKQLGHDTGRDQ